MQVQHTIREEVSCRGIALHCGGAVKVRLLPAGPHEGIVFRRLDAGADAPAIPALLANVTGHAHATAVGVGQVSVQTVEHLLAAVFGLGIDNLQILVDGPELPIFDGSAAPWVHLISSVGTVAEEDAERRFAAVRKRVYVHGMSPWSSALVLPANTLRVACSISFDHPSVGAQRFCFEHANGAFLRELASARTFGFLEDGAAMQAAGLARGASLESCIVFDEQTMLNPEPLRFSKEPVRHKVLDVLGDLVLFGTPLVGEFIMDRPSHALTHQVLHALLADPTCLSSARGTENMGH